ncbi:hypothetical protein CQA53_11885, partial [Helicobacter didelphidarum]
YQKDVLSIQLGNMWEKAYYGDGYFFYGTYQNPLRLAQVMNLVKKIKPDRFGMYPYIDEILGVDWVMDFNRNFKAIDPQRIIINTLYSAIQEGKLLDPRDPRATEQTRIEFMQAIQETIKEEQEAFTLSGFPSDWEHVKWTQQEIDLYIDTMLLIAKVMAVTPPQGYPNAPTYYIPEYLEELYREG